MKCVLKGPCKNFNKFLGQLHLLYEKHTGGYIGLREDFFGIQNLKDAKEVHVSLNFKMYNFVLDLIDIFDLELEVKRINKGSQKGYANKPNSKILIFGNTDVSPHEYCLHQSYILAEEFTAIKEKV